ncbi:MAG TPA: PilZ domain-containing protein [Candidatus Omnitrophota bacterium]|nr:PilZ domain-containing protein [Candidatus Omnitrophota bacterium]
MIAKRPERRKYDRYKTDVEIYFDFIYDLETKVKFEVIAENGETAASEKYSAVSRNVSVGGLCFSSTQKVTQGDLLHLEVFLPGSGDPVHMKGRVEWCKPVIPSYEDRLREEVEGDRPFEVGVRLMFVGDQPVEDTIHHDPTYDVDWSVVLESIFGNYRMLMEGKYKPQEKNP